MEQLKLGSDGDMYAQIVDSVVVGPAKITMDDVKNNLGIVSEVFEKSNKKRNDSISGGIQPTWTHKVENLKR